MLDFWQILRLLGGISGKLGYEDLSENPDRQKLKKLKKRREEIVAIKSYFAKSDKTYNDIRRWIDVYSKELKRLNALREPLDKAYMENKSKKAIKYAIPA